jgi:hypothetical protein
MWPPKQRPAPWTRQSRQPRPISQPASTTRIQYPRPYPRLRAACRGKVGVLKLADRRRVARQLLNGCGHLAVARNRKRVDVRIVELIEVRGDVSRVVKNVEAARDQVERSLIGLERRHGHDDRLAIRHCHCRLRVGCARIDARRVSQSECRRRVEGVWSKNKRVELAGDRGCGPRKETIETGAQWNGLWLIPR